jgi:hypothetical protein
VRATATSFPLSKHTGAGDTAPAFSGLCVYLQFTWEVGPPPSPVEFSSHRCFYKLSCSCLMGVPCCPCWLACLFTAHVGGGSSPLSCGVFLPPPFSQAFPFLVARHTSTLPPEPLWPGPACLFTVLGRIPLSSSSVLSVSHPLCNVSLLFLLLITQFLFFPWVGVSLSRELC